MKKRFALLISLFICAVISSKNCQARSEGFFAYYSLARSEEPVSLFLPYNPTILLLGDKATYEKCLQRWPLAHIITSLKECEAQKTSIDFVWIQSKPQLAYQLNRLKFSNGNIKAIYIQAPTDSLSAGSFAILKAFIEKNGLKLFTHWSEQGSDRLFFLQNKLCDGFMRSLQYDPPKQIPSLPEFPETSIECFLHPMDGKESIEHSMPEIDYIYLINLDHRTENLALTLSALERYEIFPHRFSAVNGWQLSAETINQLGLHYRQGMLHNQCLGTVFRKVEEREYVNFEFINKEGVTYFIPRMSKGTIGMLLSHLSVLKDAYDSEYETIWVMEDYIKIIEDPGQIPSLIQELNTIDPEWDLLFTDVENKDEKGNDVPCRTLAIRPDLATEPLSSFLERFYRVNDHFSRVGMRYGTYSMIIHRSGIEKILNYYKKHAFFLPYDADYWLNPSLRMYCVNKDIVSAIPGAANETNYQGKKE